MFRTFTFDRFQQLLQCYAGSVQCATEVGGTGKGGCHVECTEYPDPEYVREFNNQAQKNKDAF